MLDDLRRSASDEFEDDDEEESIDEPPRRGGSRLFGLSPVERMLLSILLFMLVSAVGVLLLLATGRIVF